MRWLDQLLEKKPIAPSPCLSDLTKMSSDSTIDIIVDPSLLDHFTEHLTRAESDIPAEVAITNLVSTILDSSPYSIRAKQTGEREIHISYHIRSFSQPIFE